MKRQGFTLIELLAVVTIIAILAAIFFPVFARVREKTRQASCQSNEKQLGLAVLMYVQDYDERFPRSQFFPSKGAITWFPYGARWRPCYDWLDALQPYVRDYNLAHCPSDHFEVYNGRRKSYALIAPPFYCEVEPQGFAVGQVIGPSEGLLFVETVLDCPFIGDWHAVCYWTGVESNNTQYDFFGNRHNEGMNMAFCDGHVKWMKVGVTKDRQENLDMWRTPFGLKPWYP